MKKIIAAAFMIIALSLTASESINLPILKNINKIENEFNEKKLANFSCASGFITTAGEWSNIQTSVYLATDEKYLYLTFKCLTGKDFNISSKEREADSEQIFSDESVEIFISPSGKEKETYYHIAINASGNVYSAKCGKERDVSWSPEIETTCGLTEGFWFINGKIALESFGLKAVEGKSFTANFCRNIKDSKFNSSSSWTGQANFNVASCFGKITFAKNAGFDYSLKNMREIIFRNNTLEESKVSWSFGNWKNSQAVEAFSTCQEKLPTENITGSTALEISADGKTISKTAVIPFVKKLSITPELYYCPLEKELMKLAISCLCKNATTITLDGKEVPAGKEFEVGLGKFKKGRNVVSAKAFDKENKLVAEDEVVIFITDDTTSELPEKQEINIDGQVFMMNGKPFFPLMASPTKNPSSLADDSFNVKYASHGVRKNAMGRGICGLPVKIDRARGVVYEIADDDVVKESIRKTIIAPVFYRQLQYEAQIPLRRKSTDEMLDGPQKYIEYYKFIKEISPKTLVSIQVDTLDKISDYMKAADIVEVASWQSSYSKYIIPNLANDIKYAKETIGNKPLVWWLGASIPNPYVRNAESLRAASYIAMIHGANGIIYHMGHDGIPQTMTRLWSLFHGLSRELEFLYPIVICGKKTDAVKFDAKEIDFTGREYEGATYIIAVNTAHSSQEISFALNAEKIDVLFENRTLVKKDGRFTDLFTGYEPHVYKISNK